jgi:hypothetical protein
MRTVDDSVELPSMTELRPQPVDDSEGYARALLASAVIGITTPADDIKGRLIRHNANVPARSPRE